MVGQLVEIALGILILIGFIRICFFLRRNSSQEEVMNQLGDALSLVSGRGISRRED